MTVKEHVQIFTKSDISGHPNPNCLWVRLVTYQELEAERDALREALTEIAKPIGQRPCDCDRCYCGNPDDAQAVADWDASNATAEIARAALQVKP